MSEKYVQKIGSQYPKRDVAFADEREIRWMGGQLSAHHTGTRTREEEEESPPELRIHEAEADLCEIVEGKLFLSSILCSHPSFLSLKGITRVVSLRKEPIAYLHSGPSLSLLHISVHDIASEDLLSHLERVFAFVDFASPLTRTLVHCEAGISRSAAMTIMLLMKAKHIRASEAYDWVKARRPIVCPNSGFVKQIIALENALFSKEDGNLFPSYVLETPDVYGHPFLARHLLDTRLKGTLATVEMATEALLETKGDCGGAMMMVVEGLKDSEKDQVKEKMGE